MLLVTPHHLKHITPSYNSPTLKIFRWFWAINRAALYLNKIGPLRARNINCTPLLHAMCVSLACHMASLHATMQRYVGTCHVSCHVSRVGHFVTSRWSDRRSLLEWSARSPWSPLKRLNLSLSLAPLPSCFTPECWMMLRIAFFLLRSLTDRFRASLNHKDDGQTKFIKPKSQR